MELQGLHEALKVEIQCHQKLAVRSCAVGPSNKPLSLIKAPGGSSQSIAISVVPAKAPVSMVTAHINGQKAAAAVASSEASPVNLQTAGSRVATGVHQTLSRRAVELHNSQMLGTLTAVPIKVPQVSSLHRLAGQAPTVLPQVRPKTHIPDSLPHSPGQEQLSGGALSLLQRGGTTVISAKNQRGPALPTANSTFSPQHQPNALPNGLGDTSSPPIIHIPIVPPPQTQKDAPMPAPMGAGVGVAYAIIAASPAMGNGMSVLSEAVKVQPLLFSTDNKVIIIQPQVPSCSQGSPGPKAVSPAQEAAPPPPPPPAKKKDEDPEKIAFMVALGLVTTEHLEEIQTKRQERKRRSTANPAYSGLFEPERKRLASNYLNNPLFLGGARDTEDLCWKEDLEHDEHCNICKEDGELQPCHNCTRAFHPNCLHPPLKTPPRGAWYCPKCQKKVLNKENMSWPQNFVQSYVTHKTVRQEEKRRLLRRNSELKKECTHLEEQDNRLNKSLTQCMDLREHLLGQQRDTQASLDRLKSLIRLIQQDQMIQVTMTATTTTTGASLLSLPWIKPAGGDQASTTTMSAPPAGPSALLHKTQSSNN